MSTRDELQADIAAIRQKLVYWLEALRNPATNEPAEEIEKRIESLRIDLAVANDSLQIYNEERADIDVPYHSSDPIQNYLHAKMRF